jgi:cyclopropane fatty-acyl-phospholipid synthase-like methyltransferase
MNHRKYVGGNWDDAGIRQLEFLKEMGLNPGHTLLDIGCGCLRAGVHFIEYLNDGNYHGVEKHYWLIEAGMQELDKNNINKVFNYTLTDDFEFDTHDVWYDYAIAKSVFTHLTKKSIKKCLDNLYLEMTSDGKFFASISEGDSRNNPTEDNETKRFVYTVEEIKELATNWDVVSHGHKGCFNQTMLEFTPR